MSDLLDRLRQWFTNWFTPPLAPDPTPVPSPEPPAPPIRPKPVSPSPTTLVVRELNAARAAEGLSALVQDVILSRISGSWAESMASWRVMDHGDFADRIIAAYPNTAAGEDIAEGQPGPASVVAAWMADPPHRANILGDFNGVGVGMARDDSGTTYWFADFIKLD